MDYDKKFIIIGNQNAIICKEIFPYIKNNQLWLGMSMNGSNRWFVAPDSYEVKENAAGYKLDEKGRKMFFVNGVTWFTNIENKIRNEKLDLYKRYSFEEIEAMDFSLDLCGYPVSEEIILSPEETVRNFKERRESFERKLDERLERIIRLLEV